MSKPLTLAEATERGLVVDGGIYTFSNSDHWCGWADVNCFECWHYDMNGSAGESCAFEGAALLSMVSPALAILFGWTEDAKFPGSYDEPEQCAFFRPRKNDGGEDNPPAPDPDPRQLVLLADPTEIIADLTPAEPLAVEAVA